MIRQRFDILIAGGGLAGAALAAALAGSGQRVAVVEGRPLRLAWPAAQPGVDGFDLRVSALTAASRRWLDSIGAWQGVAERRLQPYRHMHVWERDGTGAIDFDAAEVNQPALGHIVENRLLLASLLHALEPHDNVQVFTPARVADMRREGDAVDVVLEDGRELRTRLLVGADGADSAVRKWAGIDCRSWDYGQRAIVATIATEQPHGDTAWQIFHREGPLALLPLAGTAEDRKEGRHYCSIVWSTRSADAEQLATLGDVEFAQAVERASEARLGRVLAVGARASFPLRAQHAAAYVADTVALVGDAAHTIHPLAGQGINLGFADAQTLAEELIRAHRRGLAPSDPGVLARYQRRRKGDNLLMLGAMEGFTRLFGADPLPVRLLRNTGLQLVNRMGPLKRLLIQQAMGVR